MKYNYAFFAVLAVMNCSAQEMQPLLQAKQLIIPRSSPEFTPELVNATLQMGSVLKNPHEMRNGKPLIPTNLNMHINRLETDLLISYCQNELSWVDALSRAVVQDHTIKQTYAQEIKQRAFVSRYILDYIKHEIKKEKKKQRNCGSWIAPCNCDAERETDTKCCGSVGMFAALIPLGAVALNAILTPRAYAEPIMGKGQCAAMGMYNLLWSTQSSCTKSSIDTDSPYNVTELEEKWGDNWYTPLDQLCYAMGDAACRAVAVEYNNNTYPKEVRRSHIRAYVPLAVVVPVVAVVVIAGQIAAYKYRSAMRRYRKMAHSVDDQVTNMNDTFDKIAQGERRALAAIGTKDLNTVD